MRVVDERFPKIPISASITSSSCLVPGFDVALFHRGGGVNYGVECARQRYDDRGSLSSDII